jgi:putative NADH-flavin reductase
MKLLVIGASGPLGLEVVKMALKRSFLVSAFVRTPESFKGASSGVRAIRGDVFDLKSLEQAMIGHDAVISTFGTQLIRKPTTLLSDGTKNIVKAMESSGVHRFVCVTGIGAGNSKGHGGFLYDKILEPFLLHEIYNDKTRQEEVIKKSSLEWTIVRPAVLTNGPETGNYRIANDLFGFTATKISRKDVADFLLNEVMSNKCQKQSPVVSY